MRDSPLHSLGSLRGADNDRSLFLVAARLLGQTNETTANGHGFVMGDDETNSLGEERCIDWRLDDACFPKNIGSTIVDCGSELFLWDFGKHGNG
jgi:hypothetical protein